MAGLTTTALLASALALAAPALATTPNPAPYAGARNGATRLSFGTAGQMTASVDVGTGNLFLTANLLRLPAISSDVQLKVAYNSSTVGGSAPSSLTGQSGSGWTLTGFDQRLIINADNSITYIGPDGLTGVFVPVAGTSNYTSPTQFKASLTLQSNGTYLYVDHTSQTKVTFSAAGLMRYIDDRNGNRVTWGYASGVPAYLVTTRSGNWSTSSPTATVTTVSGHISSITQTDGGSDSRSVSFAYSASNGRLTGLTDADGNATTFAYSGGTSGNLLSSVTNAINGQTTFNYDSSNRVKSVSQTNSATGSPGTSTTRLTYSSATQTIVADPTTNLAQAASAVPHTTYTLDSASKLVTQVVDPDGHTQSAQYTGFGDLSSYNSGSGASTGTYSSQVNNGESLTATSSPTGASASTGYQGSGSTQYSPSSYTDNANNSYSYGYNPAGNQTTYGLQNATTPATVGYNSKGQPTTSATPGASPGVVTTFTYGGTSPAKNANNIVAMTPPAGSSLGQQTYNWDGYGRLKSATNARGGVTTYTYDDTDNELTTAYTNPTVAGETDTYDALGRQSTRVDASGTTTYTWDDLGRLLSVGNTAGGGTITYRYDLAGSLVSKTDSGGQTTYVYDNAHLLTSMTYPKMGGTTGTIRFAYDAYGRRTDTWLDSPTSTQWSAHNAVTYDSSGRTIRVVAQQGPANAPTVFTDQSACFNTGAPGSYTTCPTTGTDRSKVQWTRNNVTGVATTYSYDTSGRLTAVQETSGSTPTSYSYSYDTAGNRTTAVRAGTLPSSQTLSFNNANQIASAGYAYDADGNETQSPTDGTLTYNTASQLTSVTYNNSTVSYTYAGQGQREQLSGTSGSASTSYVYGKQDGNGSPEIEQTVITGNGTLNGTSYIDHDPVSGAPITFRAPNGATFLYGTDVMQGMRSLVTTDDTSGLLGGSYAISWQPYGGLGAAVRISYFWLNNPYEFKWSVGGRARFGERRLDDNTGTWSQQDSVNAPLDPANGNRYAFVGGDPVNGSDPTGLFNTACGDITCTIYFSHYETNVIQLASGLGAVLGGAFLPPPFDVVVGLAGAVVAGAATFALNDGECLSVHIGIGVAFDEYSGDWCSG